MYLLFGNTINQNPKRQIVSIGTLVPFVFNLDVRKVYKQHGKCSWTLRTHLYTKRLTPLNLADIITQSLVMHYFAFHHKFTTKADRYVEKIIINEI